MYIFKICIFTVYVHIHTYIHIHILYMYLDIYTYRGKTPSSCIGKMRRNIPGSIWIHSQIYLHETQATGSKGLAFWMEIGHNLAWFDMTVEYIYVILVYTVELKVRLVGFHSWWSICYTADDLCNASWIDLWNVQILTKKWWVFFYYTYLYRYILRWQARTKTLE